MKIFIPRRPTKSTHESELDDEDLEYLGAKEKRIGFGQSEEKDEEKEKRISDDVSLTAAKRRLRFLQCLQL